ncbi:MAG: ATP synthase F1 subunit delta [Candidatus Epulonipiscioides saccharophilum]|nr:MAG: ATP synthase F1 subunit delta [Epulopiscium sp. AS2M-Bin001]
MALVTTRYATALFDLATEKGQISDYQQEAEGVLEILNNEPDFLKILTHPSILLEEKLKLVRDIFENNASDDFVGLFYLCVKKGRQNLIMDILETFVEMAKVEAGFVKAIVTSSVKLEQAQLEQIKANLETKTGKKVEITDDVDETLLGGMIIRVGDKVVDGSIRGQLDTLKSSLLDIRLA